jgi:hypothetical protein
MAQLTVPGGTSVGVTRLGRTALGQADDLGKLADLVGTWIGAKGWELIAVPDGPENFRVIAQPYVEVLAIEPIGSPVPNRGSKDPDMFINGLMYQTRICELDTHEPLHLENGMWLNLGDSEQQPIVRQASIPHGDVFLALGTATTTEGPPTIPDLPGEPPTTGPKPRMGYLEGEYGTVPRGKVPPGFDPTNANATIQKDIEGIDIARTTELSVSTEGAGGIVNIPFVDRNAIATQFTCTYWLETIAGPAGEEVVQLQYSQQTNIEFFQQFGNPDPDQLIMWPHISVNTLRKQ